MLRVKLAAPRRLERAPRRDRRRATTRRSPACGARAARDVPAWARRRRGTSTSSARASATRCNATCSDRGVGTLIHYPIPPHRQAAYAHPAYAADAFPIASRVADEILSLPIGPHLMEVQQDRVIDVVRAFDFGRDGT